MRRIALWRDLVAMVWMVVLGGAGAASADTVVNWSHVDVWVEGATVGPTAVGSRYMATDSGASEGAGLRQLSASQSWGYDENVATNISGWAMGQARVGADPTTRTLRTYSDIWNSGQGPYQQSVNFLGTPILFPWGVLGDWFGATTTRAYSANLYQVAPGMSGLAPGQAASFVLDLRVEGALATRANTTGAVGPDGMPVSPLVYEGANCTELYVAIQVFRADASYRYDTDRYIRFFNRETEMDTGRATPGLELLVGLGHDVLDTGSVATQIVDWASGPTSFNVGVGDYLFVEYYLEMMVELPYTATAYESHSVLADFENTMASNLEPGAAFVGLTLEDAPLTLVPEPATVGLLGLSLAGLVSSRRHRRR